MSIYHEAGSGAACCASEPASRSCCTRDMNGSVKYNEDVDWDPYSKKDVETHSKVDFNEWVASYQIYAIK